MGTGSKCKDCDKNKPGKCELLEGGTCPVYMLIKAGWRQ